MNKLIDLRNSVFRGRDGREKTHLENLYLAIVDSPIVLREVFFRFADGPVLEFSTSDMDRIVFDYLTMRGVKVPPDLRRLAKLPGPPRGDFKVPAAAMAKNLRTRGTTSTPARPNHRRR